MTLKRVIIAYLLLLLAFGCTDGTFETVVDAEQATVERIARVDGYRVFRVHDRREKVTCWITVGSGNAISCMPDITEPDGRLQ